MNRCFCLSEIRKQVMSDINGDQNVNEEIFNTYKPGVELLMGMIELDIDRV